MMPTDEIKTMMIRAAEQDWAMNASTEMMNHRTT